MSSLARVRDSGSLFQSNVCNWFFLGFSCCPFYRGVRYSEVSARRELTVERKVEKLKYMKEVVEDRAAEYQKLIGTSSTDQSSISD